MPEEKVMYWSPEEVEQGKWIVLPSMRVGRLQHTVPATGRRVFVTTDGRLVCEHGELASSICKWMAAAARAAREGNPAPPRHSACDCENTDGLHWTKEMPRPDRILDQPANSFYGVLEALGTHRLSVRGRALRHVPHTCEHDALYVCQKGDMLCCRHGNSLKTLRAMRLGNRRDFRGVVCTCSTKEPPRRQGCFNPTLRRRRF